MKTIHKKKKSTKTKKSVKTTTSRDIITKTLKLIPKIPLVRAQEHMTMRILTPMLSIQRMNKMNK